MRLLRLAAPLTALALPALVVGCGAGAPAAAPGPAATTAPDAGERRATLVLGSVSDDPEEEVEVFAPFADHLASRLAGAGITGAEVVVAASVEEMAGLLGAGDVDLYVDNVHGVTSVVRDGAGVPLLRRWKDGAAEYHSVVVARRDSGITSLEQLRGRTVAFEEETSTDGYLLPAGTLVTQGLVVAELAEAGAAVPPGEVGYVFTGDDENTVFAVLEGRVDAGALSEEDLAENAGSRAGELVVVARTIDVPRHAVVGRTGLDPAVQQAAVTALVALHESADGRAAMAGFDGTTRFDALAPEDLAPVEALRAALGDGGA